MRDTNLVNALRCVSTAGGPIGDCKICPFYKTEPVPGEAAGAAAPVDSGGGASAGIAELGRLRSGTRIDKKRKRTLVE